MDQYKELVTRKYLLAQFFFFSFLPKVQKWDCALELRGLSGCSSSIGALPHAI